jgi:hypothetical protein
MSVVGTFPGTDRPIAGLPEISDRFQLFGRSAQAGLAATKSGLPLTLPLPRGTFAGLVK